MRRIPVLFLLAVAAILLFAAPASAHTELLKTDPADGAAAQTDLRTVGLTFTQQVDARLATVTVRRDGQVVSQGQPRSEGAVLVQAVEELVAGRYEVQWRAAAADGHILDGTFGFRGGKATPASSPATAEAAPERLSPAELLREHARGNYDHDATPSYAAAAEEPAPAAAVAPAAPPPPAPNNSATVIITLVAAALGVTAVGAVAESVRAGE